MLVCVYDYELTLKTKFNEKSNIVDNHLSHSNASNQPRHLGQMQPFWQSTQLNLVLRIDSIKVISFDNFLIAAK